MHVMLKKNPFRNGFADVNTNKSLVQSIQTNLSQLDVSLSSLLSLVLRLLCV